jgi:plastocyanin
MIREVIRLIRSVLAAAFLGAMLVACETEGDDTTTEGTPPAEGAAVEVVLTEFAIDMPASVPAGSVSFDIANSGTMAHNFEIEGQGIEESLDEDLDPNQAESLTVELEPGTYTVYCPIGNHREQGMEVELEVTGS